MNFRSTLTTILIVAFLLTGCGKSGEKYFEAGIEQYNSEYFNEAVKLFKKALNIEPENVKARFYLGMSYKRQGKILEALDEIKQTVEITPNDFYILYNLADCYREIENYEKGIEFSRKSLSIKPNFLESHLLLGITMYHAGELTPAAQQLEFVVKVTQKDNSAIYYDALYHLGTVYRLKKNYEASVKTFTKSLQVTPNASRLHYALGVTYLAMNDMEKVAQQISKLKELNSPEEQMLRDMLK